MNGYTLPAEVARDIREAVRHMPPIPPEDLDALAEVFRQQDEAARQARVNARLHGATPVDPGEATGGDGHAAA